MKTKQKQTAHVARMKENRWTIRIAEGYILQWKSKAGSNL